VAGEVAKPLEIYFNDRLTLTQALKEAGGILPRNKDYEVLVISEMIGGGTRIIHVDLKAIEKKAYKDFGLQDFDLVGVLPKRMEKRVLQPLKNSCPSWPAGIKF
jgi:protein involved in polysaccharide export with SLBB domain